MNVCKDFILECVMKSFNYYRKFSWEIQFMREDLWYICYEFHFLGSHIHIESWNKIIIEGRAKPDGTDCLISMVSHMWINIVDEIKRTLSFSRTSYKISFQKCITRSFILSWIFMSQFSITTICVAELS